MPKIFELPKGRIHALRERPVKDFIDGECGSFDVLTVGGDATTEEVLEKILHPENREDAVVVVAHRSELPTLGLIANIDFLHWVQRTIAKKSLENLPRMRASNIAKTDFFYVTEADPLQKAIDLMKEHKVTHVVVVNNEKEKHFLGWVTRRSVLRKLGAELGTTH